MFSLKFPTGFSGPGYKTVKVKCVALLIAGLLVCPAFAEQAPALRGLSAPPSVENTPASKDVKLAPVAPAQLKAAESKQALPSPFSTLRAGIEAKAVKEPFTLSSAVHFAQENYPAILKARAEVNAARENVTVQRLNEYMPEGLAQFQEVLASHNKLTEIFYGSPVFPASAGPGFDDTSWRPNFFSGLGFNIDWAPIDFGLHKARINLAKSQLKQVTADYAVTRFDMAVAAAASFLEVVAAQEQVKAAEENVRSFEDFLRVVDAQVRAQLKPGADAALAEAQLANARNQLFRARLSFETASANLSSSLGVGGVDVSVVNRGLVSTEEGAGIQKNQPTFEQVPILEAAKSAVATAIAQRRVLSREYYPVFHFLAGIQGRGSGLNVKGGQTSNQGYGLAPTIPNYQVAMIANWNFLDWPRLHVEKKVQDQRVAAQRHQYELILQNLKAESVRARAQVKTALEIAANMPVQVAAAELAVRQARARYAVGLASVAQVAEANQVLAQSRMQEAVANVSIWRALLANASVHGDLEPLLAEADRVQRGAP